MAKLPTFKSKLPTDNLTHYFFLIKYWLTGILISETVFLSLSIAVKLVSYVTENHYEQISIRIIVIYIIALLLYLVIRGVPVEVIKIIKSRRIDILLIFLFGLVSSLYLGGIGLSIYQNIVNILTPQQILVIFFLPFVVILSILIRFLHLLITSSKQREGSFFINDGEKSTKEEDLLNIYETAEKFAERVLNQNSPESLVFGVDAPWGIGKSTFINFCREYWLQKHRENTVVYVFSPLKYEDRENLLERFVDGLINAIQKDRFIPEIKPIVSRYAKLIKNVKGSFWGLLNIEFSDSTYSVDDAFDDLQVVLSATHKKTIVIIDDLDRLSLKAVKELLFTIKKSFTLPNVSYILCYDAENINSLEQEKPDLDKISEFLEKFVNVKVSLFLDSEKLSSYVTANLKNILPGNSQADPVLVSMAIGGLKNIFNSNHYSSYTPFIGDIRKIKRLINTVLLLDIEKTDFENSDINGYDLIHLLLIYINYPNVFRKIYNSETNGKKGFFSLLGSEYDEGYPPKERDSISSSSRLDRKYANSIYYTEYLKTINENARFLLNKTFSVEERLGEEKINRRGDIPPEISSSYACFNGDAWSSGGRNLEAYLRLIVESAKPQTVDQYTFYRNRKNDLVTGKTIEEIFTNNSDVFTPEKGESPHKQLWKMVVNSAHDFNYQLGNNLITHLVGHMSDYSHIDDEDIDLGLRHSLCFYLAQLLDQAGWVDENGEHKNNFDENITEIAERILGEGRHKKNGILDALILDDRGVLGLYDLLIFRLYCSADRGGDLFNLSRSLAKHGNSNAPVDGSTTIIAIEEMREISQRVFKIFNSKYIKQKKNIFDEIDKISVNEAVGKFREYLDEKIKSNETLSADELLAHLKARIKIFVVYQMASSSTAHGITCGYYDKTGIKKDQNKIGEIGEAINEYLFGVCFNPGKKKKNQQNYEHFLDYLLMSFSSIFEGVRGKTYAPHINEFTRALSKERLKAYWKENHTKVKELKFEDKDKSVAAGNYVANYKEDLLAVYKILDELISKPTTQLV